MRVPALFLFAAVVLGSACGDDGPAAVHDAPRPVDAATDADNLDPGCFTNPQTHYEIINACTGAERIVRHPNLPLLLPDGGLPPLP